MFSLKTSGQRNEEPRQGVEDDDMNIICLGGNVTGNSLALELVNIFLNASIKGTERYARRLEKVSVLELEMFTPLCDSREGQG